MTAAARPARRLSPLARREALWGYLFISPWVIGFLVFVLGPMIASLIFTFTNINLAQEEPLAFVGIRNWQTLLGDGQAWAAMGVTFRFAAHPAAGDPGAAVPARDRAQRPRPQGPAARSASCSSCPTSSRSCRAC